MTSAATREAGYADILNSRKILYLPSCLIVEMMTELYSQVSVVNPAGTLHHVVPDLLALLNRLTQNIQATSHAYRESRIKFFLGDWKDDKLRVRKLFFNIMSRLGYICEFTGRAEKNILHGAIENINSAWSELDGIMEDKAEERERNGKRSRTCFYFRSQHPAAWKQVMANAILALDAEADYSEPDACLILLCYKRIRLAMLQAIREIERKNPAAKKFPPEKILCVSQDDLPISCPKCTLMTDSLRKGASEVIHKGYQSKKKTIGPQSARAAGKAALGGVYPRPSAVTGIPRR